MIPRGSPVGVLLPLQSRHLGQVGAKSIKWSPHFMKITHPHNPQIHAQLMDLGTHPTCIVRRLLKSGWFYWLFLVVDSWSTRQKDCQMWGKGPMHYSSTVDRSWNSHRFHHLGHLARTPSHVPGGVVYPLILGKQWRLLVKIGNLYLYDLIWSLPCLLILAGNNVLLMWKLLAWQYQSLRVMNA